MLPTRLHLSQGYLLAAIALTLFVAGAGVGVWVSYDPTLSWPIMLTLLVSIGLFFTIPFTPFSGWSKGVVIAAGLLAFYFISQYAHFDYPLETGTVARLGRLTGSLFPSLVIFTPHPNAAAGFIEGALLINLVLIGRAEGRWRWFWLGLAGLLAYAVLISGSRGAWLGLAVAIGLWLLLIFREWAWPLALTGGGFVAGLLGSAYVITRLAEPGQRILLLTSLVDTAHSRLTLYHNSLQLFKDYPFTGIGLGDTFAMLYSRYQLLIQVPYLYYAHNLWLSVGLGQGVLGLLGLAGLLVAFYGFVIRVERTRPAEEILVFFRPAWLGVTVSLVHGLADAVQFSLDFWTMPMLFVLAGLAVATGRRALAQSEQTVYVSAPSMKFRYVNLTVWGSMIGLLLLGAVFFWRPLIAAGYANLGAIYQAKADLSPTLDETGRQQIANQATAYFEQALQVDSAQPTANRRLGQIALENHDFETAITYLERAYTQEPDNQAIFKALGYAYLWTGRLDAAENLFRQVDVSNRVVDELGYWQWWWGTQDRADLSAYAGEMAGRLSGGQ